jgi:hypothetical protein
MIEVMPAAASSFRKERRSIMDINFSDAMHAPLRFLVAG